MARKYIQLTPEQKDEIRRLTQKANRRILAFYREYKKHGLDILPFEPTGGIQTKQQWETRKYPLSRSTKFKSVQEYKKRIAFLRSFDRPGLRPTLTEYKEIARTRLLTAINSILGQVPDEVRAYVESLSPAQIQKFWDKFSEVSSKAGLQYSSEGALVETLELFDEDMADIVSRSM